MLTFFIFHLIGFLIGLNLSSVFDVDFELWVIVKI